uniref:Uncharacterized protein n=1 Tax=Arundo donax TaxID=35708 RepID=A0A0A9BHU6_ARUDO
MQDDRNSYPNLCQNYYNFVMLLLKVDCLVDFGIHLKT